MALDILFIFPFPVSLELKERKVQCTELLKSSSRLVKLLGFGIFPNIQMIEALYDQCLFPNTYMLYCLC